VNLKTKQIQILRNDECNFAYRESVFKNELKNKFIITHVIFKLKKLSPDYKFNCEYGGINEKIDEL
jgi:UDP-N-acetylmuramate dehydrogenase